MVNMTWKICGKLQEVALKGLLDDNSNQSTLKLTVGTDHLTLVRRLQIFMKIQ